MTSFVEAFASKLGEGWFSATLTPAFAFWAGGLGAWLLANRTHEGLHRLQSWFTDLDSVTRWILVIAGLLLVTASAVLAQRLSFGILRQLEGYWPAGFNGIRRRLTAARDRRLTRMEQRIQELQNRNDKNEISSDELQELSRLESVLARAPADPTLRMPTKLGNIIRAGEGRPSERYGLDTVVCWPRLWLLLPPAARVELQGARASLDSDVVALLWGVLFLVWTPFTPWVIPIALLAASLAYRAAQTSAAVYSDLLEASFDLYRKDLYEALSWPLPENPAEELEIGKQVTQYLWRGSNQPEPRFVRRDGDSSSV